jgi:hypothetical protein
MKEQTSHSGQGKRTEQGHGQAVTKDAMISAIKPPAGDDPDPVQVGQTSGRDHEGRAWPTVFLLNSQLGQKK